MGVEDESLRGKAGTLTIGSNPFNKKEISFQSTSISWRTDAAADKLELEDAGIEVKRRLRWNSLADAT